MSLTCCVCGRDATLRVRRAGDELRYCVHCVDGMAPHLSLGSLVESFVVEPTMSGTCPHCGWTDDRAKTSGFVGCPLCYESLSSGLWQEFHLAPGA